MKIKSLFLSDIHLGSPHTRAELLFELLLKYEFENLFLIGDILTQNIKTGFEDIEKFKKIVSKKGCSVIYILGNHEKNSTDNINFFPELKRYNEYIYIREAGSIYLTHGDSFHNKDFFNKMLYLLLKKIKKWAKKAEETKEMSASTIYHRKVKPLAQKYLHKSYVKYITSEAKKKNCKIAICGHIHMPEEIKQSSILYLNCGDWINNASCIIEHTNGRLELVKINI